MKLDPDKLEWFRRNSRIGIKANGDWTYDGELVENLRVQKLFHRGLKINDAGEAQLHVGTQWCYLEAVEDTLYFIDNMHLEGSVFVMRLLGGEQETLRPESLTLSAEGVLYCTLANGQQARFLRAATAAISAYLEQQDAVYGLRLDGDFIPINKE